MTPVDDIGRGPLLCCFPKDDRVRRTIEFLREFEYRQVPLADLAQRVGLGPSRLTHLFKQEMGGSLRKFLREARLMRAAQLVSSTDERISTVCYSVGFTDVSNFNHSFKKRFGVPPRQMRRQRAGLTKK